MALIRNPVFQPPKPVTLSTNYAKLLATLSDAALPPSLKMLMYELRLWKDELGRMKESVGDHLCLQKYTEWLQGQQRRVAPGFDFDVMQPEVRRDPHEEPA